MFIRHITVFSIIQTFLFKVVEVANLDGLTTPIEKIACMKSTLDSISEGVNAHLLASLTVDGIFKLLLGSQALLTLSFFYCVVVL